MTESNRKVLITGNRGFIGAWTCMKFVNSGFEAYGVGNRSSHGKRLFDEAGLARFVQKQYHADIADVGAITSIVEEAKPELIVHLAGQAIVPRAFSEPFSTFTANALGALSVLEAARRVPAVRAVICITSDKVYENCGQVWPYRETDAIGGTDIYSVSKSSAELLCSCYAETHLIDTNVNVQTIRVGNVIGGGDWSKDRLLPDLMNAVTSQSTFFVRYMNARRGFHHVMDLVDGIFKISSASLAEEIDSGDSWNLGPKNNTSAQVGDIVAMCKDIWPDLKVEDSRHRLKEDIFLAVDVSKYSARFGAPKYESRQALRKTFQWYEDYFKKISLEDLIEAELAGYGDAEEVI